jgi:hypothetical protein
VKRQTKKFSVTHAAENPVKRTNGFMLCLMQMAALKFHIIKKIHHRLKSKGKVLCLQELHTD